MLSKILNIFKLLNLLNKNCKLFFSKKKLYIRSLYLKYFIKNFLFSKSHDEFNERMRAQRSKAKTNAEKAKEEKIKADQEKASKLERDRISYITSMIMGAFCAGVILLGFISAI